MANFFEDNPSLRFQLDHPLMQRIVELKEKNFAEENREAYAPQDYADAQENYRQVLGIVGEICGDILAANAERVDAEGPTVVDGRVHYHPGTQQNHDALAQAGLYGMSLPREFGGLNFPMVPYVMATEGLLIFGGCKTVLRRLTSSLLTNSAGSISPWQTKGKPLQWGLPSLMRALTYRR